jgi:hypothetical protein
MLLNQVSEAFKEKQALLGAKKAAKELGVCLSSFYKYVAGENVPDMDVLRAATDRWGIRWKYLDPSEVLRPLKLKTSKQLVFSFLDAVRDEDIKIVEVGPKGNTVLQISFKIRFPALKT